jgi:hypothetical protein
LEERIEHVNSAYLPWVENVLKLRISSFSQGSFFN